MRWARIRVDDRTSYALVEGDDVSEVEGSPFDGYTETARRHAIRDVEFLLPVVPRNFYAMGANYAVHIAWVNEHHGMKVSVPTAADIGYRAPSALIATDEPIVIPSDSPGPVEIEGELVAVIGRTVKGVSEEEATDAILGYTLGNDLSERGWQISDRTNWRSKNTDTFKPMGPVIATGLDPVGLTIEVRVNGRRVSSYASGNMIFRPAHIVARLSRYITLYPGDVLWLGTDGSTEPVNHGDRVEIECPEIGMLRNQVVRASSQT
ncbi:MAG: fumarylacetoacetate hydrolase family protein [Candidatus Dormibacteraceae bacterium]